MASQLYLEASQPYTLKFQVQDATLQPVPNSKFDIQVQLVNQGNQLAIQFPLFNFSTLDEGYTLKSLNKLPKRFRPTFEQNFTCSNSESGEAALGGDRDKSILPVKLSPFLQA